MSPWTSEQHSAYRRTPKGRAYRARHARARYHRNREWVDAYKLEKGCIDCGYNQHSSALDFDHTDTKSFSISQKLIKSKTVLEKEITKCVVRCANCHRIKTATGVGAS